jgi:hypothetical protein
MIYYTEYTVGRFRMNLTNAGSAVASKVLSMGSTCSPLSTNTPVLQPAGACNSTVLGRWARHCDNKHLECSTKRPGAIEHVCEDNGVVPCPGRG